MEPLHSGEETRPSRPAVVPTRARFNGASPLREWKPRTVMTEDATPSLSFNGASPLRERKPAPRPRPGNSRRRFNGASPRRERKQAPRPRPPAAGDASMEPLHYGRGNGARAKPASEMHRASMEPLHYGRGNPSPGSARHLLRPGFNGASPLRERKP